MEGRRGGLQAHGSLLKRFVLVPHVTRRAGSARISTLESSRSPFTTTSRRFTVGGLDLLEHIQIGFQMSFRDPHFQHLNVVRLTSTPRDA